MNVSAFQKIILNWHKKNRRNMPWRDTRDPYRILVSEVMLQQTQVQRVALKYKEFLEAFPNLQALAKAPDRKLLKVWSGLGYWKRALALKETAKRILRKHRGRFPKDPKVLEEFPGIGPYTARALACFAFDNAEAFLDTNIRKVYLHFFFPSRRSVADKEILKVAGRVNSKICGSKKLSLREWHYALFDYGALVLKNKKINKRSKHYTKQSKFEGSFRSFRTKVMRFLLDQARQTATKSKIQRLLKKIGSPYALERILASLEKDGLIKRRRNSYSL